MEKNQNGYPTPMKPEELQAKSATENEKTVQLAMVYAPDQKFRYLYTPTIALARGTLFSELDKPLVVGGKKL